MSLADEIHDVTNEKEDFEARDDDRTPESLPSEISQSLPLEGANDAPRVVEQSLIEDAINKAAFDLNNDVIEAAQEQVENEINEVNEHSGEAPDESLKVSNRMVCWWKIVNLDLSLSFHLLV